MTVEFTANGTGSSSIEKASLKGRTIKCPGRFSVARFLLQIWDDGVA